MNPELINYFIANTEYESKPELDTKIQTSIEEISDLELSDLESRTFPVKDCWEFIGFADGVYLAASYENHLSKIEKMGEEYNQLVNEMIKDQISRRMHTLLGEDNTKTYYIYSKLAQISKEITDLENEFKILIKPSDVDIEEYKTEEGYLSITQEPAVWTIIGMDSISELDLTNSVPFSVSSNFVRKYQEGFELGANVNIPFDSRDVEEFYHTNKFELPFSTEYVIMASEQD